MRTGILLFLLCLAGTTDLDAGDLEQYKFERARKVFHKSCVECHSLSREIPWYDRMPGRQSRAKKEFRQAMDGLNFELDIDMTGRASLMTLDKIDSSVRSKRMPPRGWSNRKYKLSEDDKQTIYDWIQSERQRIIVESAPPLPPPAPEPPPLLPVEEEKSEEPYNPFKPKRNS